MTDKTAPTFTERNVRVATSWVPYNGLSISSGNGPIPMTQVDVFLEEFKKQPDNDKIMFLYTSIHVPQRIDFDTLFRVLGILLEDVHKISAAQSLVKRMNTPIPAWGMVGIFRLMKASKARKGIFDVLKQENISVITIDRVGELLRMIDDTHDQISILQVCLSRSPKKHEVTCNEVNGIISQCDNNWGRYSLLEEIVRRCNINGSNKEDIISKFDSPTDRLKVASILGVRPSNTDPPKQAFTFHMDKSCATDSPGRIIDIQASNDKLSKPPDYMYKGLTQEILVNSLKNAGVDAVRSYILNGSLPHMTTITKKTVRQILASFVLDEPKLSATEMLVKHLNVDGVSLSWIIKCFKIFIFAASRKRFFDMLPLDKCVFSIGPIETLLGMIPNTNDKATVLKACLKIGAQHHKNVVNHVGVFSILSPIKSIEEKLQLLTVFSENSNIGEQEKKLVVNCYFTPYEKIRAARILRLPIGNDENLTHHYPGDVNSDEFAKIYLDDIVNAHDDDYRLNILNLEIFKYRDFDALVKLFTSFKQDKNRVAAAIIIAKGIEGIGLMPTMMLKIFEPMKIDKYKKKVFMALIAQVHYARDVYVDFKNLAVLMETFVATKYRDAIFKGYMMNYKGKLKISLEHVRNILAMEPILPFKVLWLELINKYCQMNGPNDHIYEILDQFDQNLIRKEARLIIVSNLNQQREHDNVTIVDDVKTGNTIPSSSNPIYNKNWMTKDPIYPFFHVLQGMDFISMRPGMIPVTKEASHERNQSKSTPPQTSTKLEDPNQCVVCLERQHNVALFECGHLCLCEICAIMISNKQVDKSIECPLCRKVNKIWKKLYM